MQRNELMTGFNEQQTMDLERTEFGDWSEQNYETPHSLIDLITSEPNSSNATAPSSNGLPFMRLVCEIYISFPVAIAGLIGSVLSFVVLCHQRPRLTPTVVLQYLSLADAANLALSIPLRALRYMEPEIPGYEYAYRHIFCALYPLTFIVRLFGTWLIVVLTVDRFIAVCHPLHANRYIGRPITCTCTCVLHRSR